MTDAAPILRRLAAAEAKIAELAESLRAIREAQGQVVNQANACRDDVLRLTAAFDRAFGHLVGPPAPKVTPSPRLTLRTIEGGRPEEPTPTDAG